jgi:hypothetical protein
MIPMASMVRTPNYELNKGYQISLTDHTISGMSLKPLAGAHGPQQHFGTQFAEKRRVER